MSSLFEKSVNLGFGLFVYSKEKIEALVDDLVKNGEVKKAEASEFVSELIEKGKEQRIEVKKVVREVIKESLQIPNDPENAALRALIREELTQLVQELELVSKKDLNK